ncbi:MAG: ABC transporter ATP-binding protein [Verrucomicrobiota bacterium]
MNEKNTGQIELNRAVIQRYLGQPGSLPEQIVEQVVTRWNGDRPVLYAYIDLNDELTFNEGWLVLGPREVLFVSSDRVEDWKYVSRQDLKQIREVNGLSCTTLVFLGSSGKEPLLQVHYTKRQQRAVENIRFVLDQELEGYSTSPEDADWVYGESVSRGVKDAQASVAGNQLAVIWRLLKYFKPYKRDVSLGFAAALALTLISLVPPFLTGYVVDQILKPVESGGMDAEKMIQLAFAIVGGLGLLHVLRELCAWVRLKKLAFLGENVAYDLRNQLYSHLQAMSLRFFSKKQTGSIISRVSSDTDRLWDFVAFGVVEMTLSVVMLIGLASVLIALDWQLGLVMTLPVPIFLWAYYLHGKAINKRFLKAWRKWSSLTAVLSDTIPGMKVVKAFNQEEREIGRFGRANQSTLETFHDVHRIWTSFWPLLMFSFHLITLIVWAMALPRVMGVWGASLTTGTFVSFLMYMGMFLHPLEVIGQITRMMNRAVSSAHRVFEVIDTEPHAEEQKNRQKMKDIRGEVTFENVSFSYDGVRDNLKSVSFEIKSGEMIGLVGPSGAGKTTITNLVAGFYAATSGRVCVDGIDLAEAELGSYRRQIGMVLQEPFLFHGSILENIRYGNQVAGYDEVLEAAIAANAHDFICRLPLGYETVVGERGHTLSGGERQRVSIARAILHNPRVLILDEATSNVDTETERKIQSALDRLIDGRTVIAIAHRLSTLERADRLLVVKEGKLVEEGTHAELLALENGVYRKLHEMQTELHHAFAV